MIPLLSLIRLEMGCTASVMSSESWLHTQAQNEWILYEEQSFNQNSHYTCRSSAIHSIGTKSRISSRILAKVRLSNKPLGGGYELELMALLMIRKEYKDRLCSSLLSITLPSFLFHSLGRHKERRNSSMNVYHHGIYDTQPVLINPLMQTLQKTLNS